MAKIFFCFLGCLLWMFTGLMAFSDADSLKKELSETTIDSQQVKIYKQLGDFYQEQQPDSAIFFYDQALDIIDQQADLFYLSPEIYNQKGIALDWKGDLQAILSYQKAVDGFNQLNNTLGAGRATQNIGISYHGKIR